MMKWTKQEDDFLISNFPGGNVAYVAKVLIKSEYKVRCRVMHLKIDSEMIFKTVKPLTYDK